MSRLQWFDADQIQYDQETPYWVSRRARSLLAGFKPLQGRRCDPEVLQDMDRVINQRIGDKIARQILRDEIRALVGSVLTPAKLVQVSCALAGGYADAVCAKSLAAFANDRVAQDVLARVESLKVDDDAGDKKLQFGFLVCNSALASGRFRAELSFRSFGQWSRFLGMVNRRARVGCESPLLFMGIEMVARVERVNGDLELLAVSCTEKLAEKNYRLNRIRHRQHAACAYGAKWDCHDCPAGRNQCSLSCLNTKTSFEMKRVEPRSEVYE